MWLPMTSEATSKDPVLSIKYERISQHTAGKIKGDETNGAAEAFYISLYTQEGQSLVYLIVMGWG